MPQIFVKLKTLLLSKIQAKKASLNYTPQINWHKIAEWPFSPFHRASLHQIFLIIAQLVVLYVTASIVANIFNLLIPSAPKILSLNRPIFIPDPDEFRQRLQNLGSNPLFITGPGKNALKNSGKGKLNAQNLGPCLSAAMRSSLPIKLHGVIVLQDSTKSLASVQIQNQSEIKSVYEGDSLQGLAKIGSIRPQQIIVRNLDSLKCEFIADQNSSSNKEFNILSPKEGQSLLNKKISGIDNDGNKFKIKRAFFNEKLSDMNAILRQANSIAINNPDGTISIKVTDIEPGSVFTYLGIENNDKISHINGKPIKDTLEVMNLFGQLKSINNLQLTIVKGDGEEKVLDYGFTP